MVTAGRADEERWRDLAFAWLVCAAVSSNAIVLVRDGQAVGIGAGQQNRLDSARIAVTKADGRAEGGGCASDAFFPFRDGLDAVAAAGVRAVVQPGGSVRDEEVIAAADEHGIAMVFTGERHFRHDVGAGTRRCPMIHGIRRPRERGRPIAGGRPGGAGSLAGRWPASPICSPRADVLLRVLPAEVGRRRSSAWGGPSPSWSRSGRASSRSPTGRAGPPASAPTRSSPGCGGRPRSRRWPTSRAPVTGGPRSPRSSAAYREAGIENILALGGDPPAGRSRRRPSDYGYAAELVDDVHAAGPFSVGVAAHPELHPRSPSRDEDRRHLAAKLARADFAITQFFFEREHYLRLVDELARARRDEAGPARHHAGDQQGPGVRMAELSGAAFPAGWRIGWSR